MKKKRNDPNKKNKTARNSVLCGEALRGISLPETASIKYPCVQLLANRHAEVENYQSVLEIGDTAVRLITQVGILRIEGSDLMIRNAEALCVLIDGNIRSIVYEE